MKKLKQPDYPTWVCHTCGMNYGSWYKRGTYIGPADICSTMHLGTCGVCGTENVAVTEPRDYGYLHAEWRHELQKNTEADKK